ncbi:MAG: TA system VapC family ribonuclease toxin [Antricoccus sp.]
MTTYLLDANVLIALTAREHVHHERVSRWAVGIERFAVCPVVEGALIRFALRLGASAAEVVQSLTMVHQRSGFEFWPDELSYTDVDLKSVRGHRQVTDAYLATLAGSRPNASLATLDEGLAQVRPQQTSLVPII